jgi:hypothetical protein
MKTVRTPMDRLRILNPFGERPINTPKMACDK